MTDYAKPLPQVTDANRPYWDGLKDHEIRLCTCLSCGHLALSAFRWCPNCAAPSPEWRAVAPEGEIWSWGIFHQVYFEGFRSEAPYNSVIVRLAAGVRLYSNLVDPQREPIAIGQRVRAVFDDVTPEITLLKFARVA